MNELLVLLGLKKKTADYFINQKNEMFNIFAKTKENLLELIKEQQLHINKQSEIELNAQKEINVTNASMEASIVTITNLEKFIN